MTPKFGYVWGAAALAALMTGLALGTAVQSQGPAPYTVLLREERRQLPVRVFGSQEMFALDDLAKLFNLTVREDALAGGLTISTSGQTIAMTPGQGLVSVGGRVVSLPAPPARDGRAWFVPLDFVPRALAPALDTRLELRRASRLVVSGDLRVPRVTTRIEQQPASVRVTFDVAPLTPHTISREANRLVVRFEADMLDAALTTSPSPDLLQGISPAESGAAVVLELGPRFASFRTAESAGDRGAGRIVIDVAATADDVPAAPPTTTTATPDPPPLLEFAPPGIRTIVIDAGHGGDEQGARGPQGTLEKDVTLAVARRLKSAIEVRLGTRVILTREGDQTVGLDERAAVANNNKADLFISLHANASVRPAVSGAEVFYLSLADYGEEAQRLQGDSERVPVLGGGTRDIEVIRWEMAQARHIASSARFARLVEASLRERVPMSARAIQQAPFRVLVGANMPAVLLEMGFISNAEQEKQLASEAFQSAIVQALVESVIRFRDGGGELPAATVAGHAAGDRP